MKGNALFFVKILNDVIASNKCTLFIDILIVFRLITNIIKSKNTHSKY